MKFGVLAVMILCGMVLKAQDSRTFSFQGTVTDKSNGETLEGFLVDVYEGNSITQSVESEKKGRFNVELFGGGEYTIDISSAGYYSKRVVVRTNIPADVKKLPLFKFEIELMSKSEYEDLEVTDPFSTSIFDFPYVIFEYDESLKDLNYRKSYTDHIKMKYDEVAEMMR